jgi:hypothetical protein
LISLTNSYNHIDHQNIIIIVTVNIHSRFDHKTECIRIGLNIETTTNTVNRLTHRIIQEIIESNRNTIHIPEIENI